MIVPRSFSIARHGMSVLDIYIHNMMLISSPSKPPQNRHRIISSDKLPPGSCARSVCAVRLLPSPTEYEEYTITWCCAHQRRDATYLYAAIDVAETTIRHDSIAGRRDKGERRAKSVIGYRRSDDQTTTPHTNGCSPHGTLERESTFSERNKTIDSQMPDIAGACMGRVFFRVSCVTPALLALRR